MKFTLEYQSDVAGADPAFFDGDALARVARAAEAAGFDTLCLADHPAPSVKWFDAGGHDTLDPTVALAFAAAATTRLRLMTNLYVLPFRNPYLAAKSLTTLDRLSAGRLTVGAGAGYLRSEFAALGVAFEDRARLFDEHLSALVGIWTDPGTPVTGADFGATGPVRLLGPTQRPRPPLWIGGNSRAAVRRVVELGEGWCPVVGSSSMTTSIRTSSIPDHDALAVRIGELHTALAAAGRDRSTVSVQVEAPSVDFDDPARVSDFGPRVEQLAEIGVTHLIVHAEGSSVEAGVDFVTRFGSEFIS